MPVGRLTEAFRQATQSRIITSAHRINRGSIPDLSQHSADSDVQTDDPETAVARIIELVKTRITKRFGVEEAGCVGRAEEGCRHRRPKCLGPTTVVEVAGMALPQFIFITADQHDDLSHGRSILHCRTDLAYHIVAARLEITEVETKR